MTAGMRELIAKAAGSARSHKVTAAHAKQDGYESTAAFHYEVALGLEEAIAKVKAEHVGEVRREIWGDA